MRDPPKIEYWSVPRCWPGECVAILAGGKSLTRADVGYVAGKCRVIAINRAFQIAPTSDWLYGCDAERFWEWHPEAVQFEGVRITVRPAGNVTSMPAKWPKLKQLADAGVKILRHTGPDYPNPTPRHEGASHHPGVVYGNNSLYQLLSVIAHTGVSTVLLLGADMRGGHWHDGYAMAEPDYAASIVPNFAFLAKPLETAGVTVLNASPRSAITCWPMIDLRSVL
jgi:hypothetical protein